MTVSDDGMTIRAVPDDPGSATLLLERFDVGPSHAHYRTVNVDLPVIEFHFDRPDHMDAYAYNDRGSICVVRPAEGNLVAPVSADGSQNDEPDGEGGATGGDDDVGSSAGDSGSAEGDARMPANVFVPEPGETQLTVAGDTFTFSGGLDCTITDDTFLVTGTTVSGENQVDIAVNGHRIGDQWADGINAVASTSGISISSIGEAVSTVIIDGNTLYIEGEYFRTRNEDFASAEIMGIGTVVANCG